MIMAQVGVPYLDILDAFEATTMREGHIIANAADKRRYLSYWNAEIELFQDWIMSVRSDNTFAKKQLFHAMGNGALMAKIDVIKSQLISIPEASDLLEILRGIVDDVRMLN